MFHGRFEEAPVKPGSVDLVVTSPPYGIGKSYEKATSIEAYGAWAKGVVRRMGELVRAGGSVAWQVGNHVERGGAIFPLDVLFVPLFLEQGFELRNRLVWRVGHGLHAQKKLSGRYEVLLWFVKKGGAFTFNLDEVREPSLYPGKTAYKGPRAGELSGNPLGANPSDVWEVLWSEWDSGVMDIPPVKNNHVEKTRHPCQFPVELAERCVLLFSNRGDLVFDPFAGVGSTLVAARFHHRRLAGAEMDKDFYDLACERLRRATEASLPTRKIGTPIAVSSEGTKARQYPEAWKPALAAAAKRRRLAPTPTQEYAQKILNPNPKKAK